MSSKGVQMPKGVQRPKGVQAGRSSVMRLATPETIEAMKLPPPKGQLEVVPQSFQGIPPPPITPAQKKALAQAKEQPFLLPGMGPMISMAKDGGPSLPAAPIEKKKKLRMIKETPDYRPIERTLPTDNLEQIREHMSSREDGTSIAEDYMTKQTDIETKNDGGITRLLKSIPGTIKVRILY